MNNKKAALEQKLHFLDAILKGNDIEKEWLRFLNYTRVQAEGEVKRISTLLKKEREISK